MAEWLYPGGYVVSRGGTFGVVARTYRDMYDRECVVIRWGPLRWLTPVLAKDCFRLRSTFESEARAEAERILAALPE